jgi:hypothetical protein
MRLVHVFLVMSLVVLWQHQPAFALGPDIPTAAQIACAQECDKRADDCARRKKETQEYVRLYTQTCGRLGSDGYKVFQCDQKLVGACYETRHECVKQCAPNLTR